MDVGRLCDWGWACEEVVWVVRGSGWCEGGQHLYIALCSL